MNEFLPTLSYNDVLFVIEVTGVSKHVTFFFKVLPQDINWDTDTTCVAQTHFCQALAAGRITSHLHPEHRMVDSVLERCTKKRIKNLTDAMRCLALCIIAKYLLCGPA